MAKNVSVESDDDEITFKKPAPQLNSQETESHKENNSDITPIDRY